MLPAFDEMYIPILFTTVFESPTLLPDDKIRQEVIDWFKLTPEDLAELTTGERKRNPNAPDPPIVNLFEKRLSIALSDLRVAKAIIQARIQKSHWAGKPGLDLLKYILQHFDSRRFTRTDLVAYSRIYATQASHHRPMNSSFPITQYELDPVIASRLDARLGL